MLQLPATPSQVLAQVIVPTFQQLLPAKFDTPIARVLLLAIALQESGLRVRVQQGGPAHGLWQCEQGGGVHGVLTSSASRAYARGVCCVRSVAPIESDVYWALVSDDLLACAIARLILWCDPHPLPALGDVDDAWICYQKNWGPGKPRPQDWPANYAAALAAVTGVSA